MQLRMHAKARNKKNNNTRSSEFAFPGYCSSELNFIWTKFHLNSKKCKLRMQNAKKRGE